MVITTCGTSNLEIAVIGVPFVAVYRLNRLSYFLGKGFVKIDKYSIVNILAQQPVITELIQENFKAENIAKEVRKVLKNDAVRVEMLNRFSKIREMVSQEKNPPEIIFNKIAADLGLRPS
jgi:lipid-A-disaccharide synthase